MLRVNEAIETVLQHVERQKSIEIHFSEALGKILAEDVFSDLNMPPFNRSMMDGYALCAEDAKVASARLQVVGFIGAGAFPKFALEPGQAVKIMTGAPLPEGADAVREVEKTRELDGGKRVEILEPVKPWQHVVRAATEIGEGEIVVTAGTYLHPSVIGLLGTIGKIRLKVFRAPEIAILATGDELVDPGTRPLSGQIRNSNSYTIQALCRKMGLHTRLLGIARDDPGALKNKILQGLQSDVLIISGGVSMGDLDFVKDVIAGLELKVLFDKVAIKPGKPTMFATSAQKVVFGLPGNPVSGATVFEIIVRPALRKMMGYPVYHDTQVQSTLTKFFTNRSKRENFHPCVTWYEDGRFYSRPLITKGSGDILAYSRSNSYLRCPIEVAELNEGDQVPVILRDDFYLT